MRIPSAGAGVLGQGVVSWEMGMFGVYENDSLVEVCATYSEAMEGFSVETSTTEDTASEFCRVRIS